MHTLLILLLVSVGWGSEKAPELSSTGKRRLSQNLEILEQNAKTATSNIETTKKNVATLKEELKGLDAVEKEYLALQKKYSNHLAASEREFEKNEKSLAELQKYLVQFPKGNENQVRKVKQEKQEREVWKVEAEAKLSKVRSLLATTNESLKKVQSRRGPIQSQIELQSKKQTDYEKALSDTVNKKLEIEQLLSSQ